VEPIVRYAIEIDPDDRQAPVHVHTVGLDFVKPQARSFECDIPWVVSQDWPTAVTDAARHLSAISVRRRQESDKYHQTGVINDFTDADWDAFVIFSPYAFDGTVWAERWESLAHFSDSGTAFCLWLTDDQKARFTQLVPDAYLYPCLTRRQRREKRRAGSAG
jgi:hypothetical protein